MCKAACEGSVGRGAKGCVRGEHARGHEEVSGGHGESVGARGVCDRSACARGLWNGQGVGEGVRGCGGVCGGNGV